eukprot:TRINITY_DN67290_c5_g2_i1.p1 TRINITY_DN67290_c5_g2~~TRINITY_DN67290_c5_g2_i1.p1  ORF type:complete len:1313 (+),score=817.69 TRINITY_DN67290_c5_g2_i1:39-3977(+)
MMRTMKITAVAAVFLVVVASAAVVDAASLTTRAGALNPGGSDSSGSSGGSASALSLSSTASASAPTSGSASTSASASSSSGSAATSASAGSVSASGGGSGSVSLASKAESEESLPPIPQIQIPITQDLFKKAGCHYPHPGLRDDTTSARAFPNSPCASCRFVVFHLAKEAIELKLTEEDIIIHAQTYCQQESLAQPLRLQCNVYEDVAEWLRKGGMLPDLAAAGKPVDYEQFANAPERFCERVALCGDRPKDDPHPAQPTPVGPPGAVIMRMKLKSNVTSISRSSAQWSEFVKVFLGDVADALNIPAARLQLHMHADDELTEVVIRRDDGSDSHPQPGVVRTTSETPEQLAHRFKVMVASGKLPKHPWRILSHVDPSFKVQTVPLRIPPSVPIVKRGVHHAKPVRTDCERMLAHSQAECGENFRCTTKCHDAFRDYFGKCMASGLTEDDRDRIEQQFKEYFVRCEKCTDDRAALVKHKCGLEKGNLGMPQACSVACSDVFLPYYRECLAFQEEAMTPHEQAATQAFHRLCSKCTPTRVEAVHQVCSYRSWHPESPYPESCTHKCAKDYVPLYDSCFDAEEAADRPKGATAFRDKCHTALSGGLGVRFKLNADIAQVPDMVQFKEDIRADCARALNVDIKRVEVTAVHAGSIVVDVILLATQKPSEVSPETIVHEIREQLANPVSPIYKKTTVLSHTDPNFGAHTLIPGTHDEDGRPAPTSLELAQAAYNAAKKNGVDAAHLEELRDIVEYQKDREYGANSKVLGVDNAQLEYQHNLNEGGSKDQQLADYQAILYAKDIVDGATPEQLRSDKALLDYLLLVAAKASPLMIQKAKEIAQYMQAFEYGGQTPMTDELSAMIKYHGDIIDKASVDQLRLDLALLKRAKDLAHKASKKQIDFDQSVVEYLSLVHKHAPHTWLDAAEAVVEFYKAKRDGAPDFILKVREAVVDYQNGVKNGAAQAELARLYQRVLDLQRQAHNPLYQAGLQDIQKDDDDEYQAAYLADLQREAAEKAAQYLADNNPNESEYQTYLASIDEKEANSDELNPEYNAYMAQMAEYENKVMQAEKEYQQAQVEYAKNPHKPKPKPVVVKMPPKPQPKAKPVHAPAGYVGMVDYMHKVKHQQHLDYQAAMDKLLAEQKAKHDAEVKKQAEYQAYVDKVKAEKAAAKAKAAAQAKAQAEAKAKAEAEKAAKAKAKAEAEAAKAAKAAEEAQKKGDAEAKAKAEKAKKEAEKKAKEAAKEAAYQAAIEAEYQKAASYQKAVSGGSGNKASSYGGYMGSSTTAKSSSYQGHHHQAPKKAPALLDIYEVAPNRFRIE